MRHILLKVLPVYLMYQRCRVESVRYTDGHGHSKPHNGIKHKVAYNLVQWLTMKHRKKRLDDFFLQEVLLGFKNDGIIIN